MSGSVLVLEEPTCFVVACFKTECPEHGDGAGEPPWVSDHETRAQAVAAAKAHRTFVVEYWKPDRCEACGQRVKESA